MKSVKKASAAKTSSKKAPAVKKAAATPMAPPATDCEKLKEPKAGIRGEYYFVVKIVPKAKKEPIRTRFVGTIHYTDEQSAAATKKPGLELQVVPTTRQSLNKYRFEVQDLNSKLDDMKQAECALDSQDGVAWRSNADDYIILKAVIR